MRYVSSQDRKKVAAALASGTKNAHAFSSSPRSVPDRRGEQPESVPRRPTRPGRPLEHPAQPGRRGPNHTYTATCHTGVHGQARREGSVAAVPALAHCCWVTA